LVSVSVGGSAVAPAHLETICMSVGFRADGINCPFVLNCPCAFHPPAMDQEISHK